MLLDCTGLHRGDLQTLKIFNYPNAPKYLKQKNNQTKQQNKDNNNKKITQLYV